MSDDLISRHQAVEAVEKESQIDGAYGYMDTKSIVDLLNDLPSVQPEQKHGKWIIHNHLVGNELLDENEVFICSACLVQRTKRKYNFCPNCGARMEGEVIK